MNRYKFALIIALSAFIFGCSEQSNKTGEKTATIAPTESQVPIDEREVKIGPVEATVGTALTIRTDKNAFNSEEISWRINGNTDLSTKGVRFSTDDIQKGDTVQAALHIGNKEYLSNEIVIKNTPPAIVHAEMEPRKPTVSSTLIAHVEVHDADNDRCSLSYKWTVNGIFAGEESYLETDMRRDDKIAVEVTPFDGEEYGKRVILKTKIFNSPPVLSENTSSFDGKTYSYQIVAADPDNDALTYKLHRSPQGMRLDATTGTVTWEIDPGQEGVHEADVLITDNNGGILIVPLTTTVSFKEAQLQEK